MFYKIDQRVLDGVFSVANSRQTNQANNANNIVWQDDRNKLNEIYLYNFNTKQTKVLGQNGLNHYFPKVAGQNVVWQSNNALIMGWMKPCRRHPAKWQSFTGLPKHL